MEMPTTQCGDGCNAAHDHVRADAKALLQVAVQRGGGQAHTANRGRGSYHQNVSLALGRVPARGKFYERYGRGPDSADDSNMIETQPEVCCSMVCKDVVECRPCKTESGCHQVGKNGCCARRRQTHYSASKACRVCGEPKSGEQM